MGNNTSKKEEVIPASSSPPDHEQMSTEAAVHNPHEKLSTEAAVHSPREKLSIEVAVYNPCKKPSTEAAVQSSLFTTDHQKLTEHEVTVHSPPLNISHEKLSKVEESQGDSLMEVDPLASPYPVRDYDHGSNDNNQSPPGANNVSTDASFDLTSHRWVSLQKRRRKRRKGKL